MYPVLKSTHSANVVRTHDSEVEIYILNVILKQNIAFKTLKQ